MFPLIAIRPNSNLETTFFNPVQHLNNLEESMREVSNANESLRNQLDESVLKESADANLSIKLQSAEEQLRNVKQAVVEIQQQREVINVTLITMLSFSSLYRVFICC